MLFLDHAGKGRVQNENFCQILLYLDSPQALQPRLCHSIAKLAGLKEIDRMTDR